MRILIIWTLLLLNTIVHGQMNYSDSLLAKLQKAQNDSIRATVLNKLAWEISYTNLDSGLVYGMKSLELATKNNFNFLYGDIYNTIGAIYSDKGDYEKALKYLHAGLKFAEENKQEYLLGNIYNSLGILIHRKGDDKEAILYYYKSLENYSNAGREKSVNIMYSNLSGAYSDLQMFDSALLYINKSIDYNTKTKSIKNLAYNYVNASEIYTQLKKYNEASKFAATCLNLARQVDDNYLLVHALNSLGRSLNQQGKHFEAIALSKEALEICTNTGELEALKMSHQYLSKAYYALNDFKNSHYHLEKYQIYKDSMLNENNNRLVKELESKYDNERKKKEIIELNEKNKISTIEADKNKSIMLMAIAATLLLLILAGVLYNRNTIKQKANLKLALFNSEINEQKELLEIKNKEITDSINYAKRIQQNTLTSDNYFKKHTTDYFILFKPKDIVSGDFYWAYASNEDFIIVTADCTGHGVPGAMMSLLGINLLNEIIVERKITQPAVILNNLRANIIKILNPEESDIEAKDGMDCTVLQINKQTLESNYCNANNYFYLIRNGQLTKSNTNKMPVGAGHNAHLEFILEKLKLNKNDLIIMLTDGYPDQFGGPRGKKFKYKAFEEILIANAHLPLELLKHKLNKEIEIWKGDLEQVDDICVIGIKI